MQRHREIIRLAGSTRSYAFTLNLHPRFEALLAGKSKPMREVGKRMNANLRRIDQHNLPIMLVLEATRGKARLHLHGLYIGTADLKKPVGQAMRAAVGYITGRSGSRQFMARSVFDAEGWHCYIRKDQAWTRKFVKLSSKDDLWWVSRSMTVLARQHYEATRLGKTKPVNTNAVISLPGGCTAA